MKKVFVCCAGLSLFFLVPHLVEGHGKWRSSNDVAKLGPGGTQVLRNNPYQLRYKPNFPYNPYQYPLQPEDLSVPPYNPYQYLYNPQHPNIVYYDPLQLQGSVQYPYNPYPNPQRGFEQEFLNKQYQTPLQSMSSPKFPNYPYYNRLQMVPQNLKYDPLEYKTSEAKENMTTHESLPKPQVTYFKLESPQPFPNKPSEDYQDITKETKAEQKSSPKFSFNVLEPEYTKTFTKPSEDNQDVTKENMTVDTSLQKPPFNQLRREDQRTFNYEPLDDNNEVAPKETKTGHKLSQKPLLKSFQPDKVQTSVSKPSENKQNVTNMTMTDHAISLQSPSNTLQPEYLHQLNKQLEYNNGITEGTPTLQTSSQQAPYNLPQNPQTFNYKPEFINDVTKRTVTEQTPLLQSSCNCSQPGDSQTFSSNSEFVNHPTKGAITTHTPESPSNHFQRENQRTFETTPSEDNNGVTKETITGHTFSQHSPFSPTQSETRYTDNKISEDTNNINKQTMTEHTPSPKSPLYITPLGNPTKSILKSSEDNHDVTKETMTDDRFSPKPPLNILQPDYHRTVINKTPEDNLSATKKTKTDHTFSPKFPFNASQPVNPHQFASSENNQDEREEDQIDHKLLPKYPASNITADGQPKFIYDLVNKTYEVTNENPTEHKSLPKYPSNTLHPEAPPKLTLDKSKLSLKEGKQTKQQQLPTSPVQHVESKSPVNVIYDTVKNKYEVIKENVMDQQLFPKYPYVPYQVKNPQMIPYVHSKDRNVNERGQTRYPLLPQYPINPFQRRSPPMFFY